MESPIDKPLLVADGPMIGFNGAILNGLSVHPDRQHLMYAVGNTVVVEDTNTKEQEYLRGHTNNVTCIAVSKSGKYIASGQVTHQGFKADVIIWDFEKRQKHAKLTLHKVKVEALAFSPNDKYLASLGGEDDGSVVIWNVANGEAVCGAPAQVASAGMTHTIAYAHNSDEVFVTAGNGTLSVWTLDAANRKIKPEDVKLGQLKRAVKCLAVSEKDDFVYCGTTTGDILEINMNSKNVSTHSTSLVGNGVTALALLKKEGHLLVGSGDGNVYEFKICSKKDKKDIKEIKKLSKSAKVTGTVTNSSVTSITLRGNGHQFFVGTSACNIYTFTYCDFKGTLLSTCHDSEINDMHTLHNDSHLFLTCGYQSVRIWNTHNKELVRIEVPNKTCNAVEVNKPGELIITGWDDGIIRGFTPVSGKMLFKLENAHGGGVTALALFSGKDGTDRIVSGGQKGDVRVWKINRDNRNNYSVQIKFPLQEHKAKVTSIKVTASDRECVTSSIDGSCIIWDLENQCRRQMVRVNTLFSYVCYEPTSFHQIIATGSDRKIGYFETTDGSTIREIEGSTSGAINCMDISGDGRYFVSGGDDNLIKLWKYDEGVPTHIGVGHSAPITRVKIAYNKEYIVSASKDGAIWKWKFPFYDDGMQQQYSS